MLLHLSKDQSARLLKHVVRCYLRLSDNPRAREALRQCLPDQLRVCSGEGGSDGGEEGGREREGDGGGEGGREVVKELNMVYNVTCACLTIPELGRH